MKNKKKSRSLVIALAVLLAMVCILLIVQRKADDYENQDNTVTLIDVTADEITAVGVTADGVEMSFTLEDDTWINDQDETLKIDESQVNLLTASLTGVSVSETMTEVEDLEQYGLGDAAGSYQITTKDGEEITIHVGDTNSTASTVYVYLNDNTETVYAVSTSIYTHLYDVVDDYIEEEVEEASSDAESVETASSDTE